MRMVALVAVGVVSASCFSATRYDDAHVQRVVSINARYQAETRRERSEYLAQLAVLGRLRAAVIPMTPASPARPISRVADRDELVACRQMCQRAPADGSGQAASCVREVCQPQYGAALVATYFAADFAQVMSRLIIEDREDIESLLALSHNQSIAARLDDQRRSLAALEAHAHAGLEGERLREIEASLQLRDSARAVHRARVRAAADARNAGLHGVPRVAPPVPPALPPPAPRSQPPSTAPPPPAASSPTSSLRATCEVPTPALAAPRRAITPRRSSSVIRDRSAVLAAGGVVNRPG